MFCVPCPTSVWGRQEAIGTAPWSALNAAAQGVAKHEAMQPHFQACIVCQRMAGAAGSDNGNSNSNGNGNGNGDSNGNGNGNGNGSGNGDSNGNSKQGQKDQPQGQGQGQGPLLLCSTCPSSFHLSCLRPRLRVMPAAGVKWSCAYCFATGRAQGGDSDGACGAVRLMESLRQGMQGAVRVRMMCFVCCCFGRLL